MRSMARTIIATMFAAAAAAATLTGCGSDTTDNTTGDDTSNGSSSDTGSASSSQKSSNHRTLNKTDLTKALLGVTDLPPGYSQDPPSKDTTKTFCNYKPPFTEKVYVSRDFTKGAGLSGELLRVGLRQYATTDQAKAAFGALADTLKTCTSETIDGTKLTYTPVSAAKVGDGAVAVKIDTGQATLLQNYVLDGPTLVTVGGGGIMNANADQINDLLRTQVNHYDAAATG